RLSGRWRWIVHGRELTEDDAPTLTQRLELELVERLPLLIGASFEHAKHERWTGVPEPSHKGQAVLILRVLVPQGFVFGGDCTGPSPLALVIVGHGGKPLGLRARAPIAITAAPF